MTRRPARRTAACLAVMMIGAVALTACGSGSGSGSSTGSGSGSTAARHIPPPVDACPPTTTQWRPLTGVSVDAVVTGSGPAVIFANDSGNNVCGWLALATRLVSTGHRIAMFTWSNPSAMADPGNLTTLLAVASAAAQGRPYALVGASLGGRLVIEAAATRPARLTGIVSLSGEAQLPDGRDITPDARRVTLPALYVGSREDGYTQGVRQQNALHQAMRGRPNDLLQRPGSAHGVQLLTGADGPVVVPRVLGFLASLVN